MNIGIKTGKDSYGLINYLLEKEGAERRASNLFGDSAQELAEEFRMVAGLNPRVKNTTKHFFISLPPGERAEPEQIDAITQSLLEKRGYENCPYVSVEHFDRTEKNNVQHWHIAASTVGFDGKWVSDSFEKVKIQQIERDLEQEFNLQTKEPSQELSRNLTNGETRREERTGQASQKTQIWDAIDRAAEGKPELGEYCQRLEEQGINAQFHVTREGNIKGMAYELEDEKGSEQYRITSKKLGKDYRFKDLLSRIDFDLERDADAIAQHSKSNSTKEKEVSEIAEKVRTHDQNLKLNEEIKMVQDNSQQPKQKRLDERDKEEEVDLFLQQQRLAERDKKANLDSIASSQGVEQDAEQLESQEGLAYGEESVEESNSKGFQKKLSLSKGGGGNLSFILNLIKIQQQIANRHFREQEQLKLQQPNSLGGYMQSQDMNLSAEMQSMLNQPNNEQALSAEMESMLSEQQNYENQAIENEVALESQEMMAEQEQSVESSQVVENQALENELSTEMQEMVAEPEPSADYFQEIENQSAENELSTEMQTMLAEQEQNYQAQEQTLDYSREIER